MQILPFHFLSFFFFFFYFYFISLFVRVFTLKYLTAAAPARYYAATRFLKRQDLKVCIKYTLLVF